MRVKYNVRTFGAINIDTMVFILLHIPVLKGINDGLGEQRLDVKNNV